MAINSNILLSGRVGDVGQTIESALNNYEKTQQIKESKKLSADNENQRRLKSLSTFGAKVSPMLSTNDIEGVKNITRQRISQLSEQGVSTEDSEEFLSLLDSNPELAKQRAGQAVQLGQRLGFFAGQQGSTTAQRNRQSLIDIINNPDASEDERSIARIEAGLDPRAVGASAKSVDVGGVPHIFDPVKKTFIPAVVEDQKVTAETVGESKSIIKEREKSGELSAQLKLSPKVKLAVNNALEASKAMAKVNEKNRSNSSALAVYEAGIGALSESLESTSTGPIVGRMVALTANQQAADGAVAAMAPILKQMFRSAGEGNFTDADQKLLLDMIPTRTDRPEARAAKLRNIDVIVRAKLRMEEGGLEGDQPQQNQDLTPEEQAELEALRLELGDQ